MVIMVQMVALELVTVSSMSVLAGAMDIGAQS